MPLDFLYTINHKYLLPACVSILSVILHNEEYILRFHIITSDFELEDYQTIEKMIENYDQIKVFYYHLEDYAIEKYNIPPFRGTQIANARLFFEEIIKLESIEKLLYLDADTIIVKNLKTLFSHEGAINAVEETTFKSRIKERGFKRYFNSGVLLFEIEKWIKEENFKKILDYRQFHPDEKLILPDQDLLNRAIGDEINELPIEYNFLPFALINWCNFNKKFYQDERRTSRILNLEEKIQEATIYHSAGLANIKPWHQNKVNPFTAEFENIAKMINPNFELEELTGVKSFFANKKILFYFLLYMKQICLPEKIGNSSFLLSLLKK